MGWGYSWQPYVPVATRRRNAEKEAARRAKKGQLLAPVQVQGRKIATTFWGKAWCEHLEAHSDFANRLPRGMTYVRNGSVIDLQVREGRVTALVSGSDLYDVRVDIAPLPAERWQALASACAGRIDSLVELLQGRLEAAVLAKLCDRKDGLFPQSRQMTFDCSCPDGASMCKHVAAALYGVGHRLDAQPELLFTLRRVDHAELLKHAAQAPVVTPATAPMLDEASLGALFGLEMDGVDMGPLPAVAAIAQPAPPPVHGHAPVPVPPSTVPLAKPAAAPSATSRAKHQKAVEYVLGVLGEYADSECSVADLYDWQSARPVLARAALRAALVDLRAAGRVTCCEDGGVVYWAVARGR